MQQTLSGQTAIISGGLGDIGRAIATELSTRAASVAIGDLAEPSAAEEFLASLRRKTPARYDRVDVADADAVHRWVEAVESHLGTPTLIVPNAAIVTMAGCRTLTPQQWRHELQVNLDGAFHLAQAATNRLAEQGKPGRVVFIGSWAGHAPHPQITSYSVSKAAMRMLCRCMALELAPLNIMVNEVAPGYVDAGLSGRIFTTDAAVRQRAVERVPTHELIDPRDVALQVAHLCDPSTRHVTGSVLVMDGGLSLG